MKKTLILVLTAVTLTYCSSPRNATRNPVDAVKGALTLHPAFTDLQTKSDQFIFFLDANSRTLFMTTDTTLYELFSKHLPERSIPGNVVLLEGSFIDPFTVFSTDDFDALNKKMKKLGVELNNYRVARIFSYGLVTGSAGKTSINTAPDGWKKIDSPDPTQKRRYTPQKKPVTDDRW